MKIETFFQFSVDAQALARKFLLVLLLVEISQLAYAADPNCLQLIRRAGRDKFSDFVRGLVENSPEDTPRLAFADWLDEHGFSDRAEFIRLHVKKARLPKYDREHFDIDQRLGQLLLASAKKWIAIGVSLEDLKVSKFRRGFLEKFTVKASDLIAHASRMQGNILAFGLSIHFDSQRELNDLFARPEIFRGIESLEFWTEANDEFNLAGLAAVPTITSLKDIHLPHNFDTRSVSALLEPKSFATSLSTMRNLPQADDIYEILSTSERAPQVTRLSFHGGRTLGGPPVSRFASLAAPKSRLYNLEELEIEAPTEGHLASALVENHSWSKMKVLNLACDRNYNLVSVAERISALKTGLPALESLTLVGGSLGVSGARALASGGPSSPLKNLKKLYLRSNHVGPEGFAAIVSQVSGLAHLVELSVVANGLTVDAVRGWQDARIENLKELDLSENDFNFSSDRGYQFIPLLSSRKLPHLESLNLSATSLPALPQEIHDPLPFPSLASLDISTLDWTDSDLAQVAKSSAASSLKAIRLGSFRYTNTGVRALLKVMPGIQELSINATPVDGKLISTLAVDGGFNDLRKLNLRYTDLSDTEADAIGKNFANLPRLTDLVLVSPRLSFSGVKLILSQPKAKFRDVVVGGSFNDLDYLRKSLAQYHPNGPMQLKIVISEETERRAEVRQIFREWADKNMVHVTFPSPETAP